MRFHKVLLVGFESFINQSLGAIGYQIQYTRPAQSVFFPRMRRLWIDDEPIVRTVKAHLDRCVTPPTLPALGDRWGAYALRLRSLIKQASTVQDILFLGQAPSSGVESHPGELFGYCQSTDLALLAELPSDLYKAFQSFHSPKVIQPQFVIEYGGRRLDHVTLSAAQDILTILKWLDQERPEAICDIGGGTGKYTLAWLTNSAHRPRLVTILDVPETLVYSEAMLRSELGNEHIQYISSPTDVPNRSGVVLCPIANARALESVSFDLVTNRGSMQEMTDAWIDWYMEWLDRQPCRFFWSENYFAPPLAYMLEGHNSWSPRPSPHWQLTHAETAVGIRNSAAMMFRKDGKANHEPIASTAKSIDGWLKHLDIARTKQDEASLRGALDFARAELPFWPKEAWQVAKSLSEITGSTADREMFQRLDLMRKGGKEGLGPVGWKRQL